MQHSLLLSERRGFNETSCPYSMTRLSMLLGRLQGLADHTTEELVLRRWLLVTHYFLHATEYTLVAAIS